MLRNVSNGNLSWWACVGHVFFLSICFSYFLPAAKYITFHNNMLFTTVYVFATLCLTSIPTQWQCKFLIACRRFAVQFFGCLLNIDALLLAWWETRTHGRSPNTNKGQVKMKNVISNLYSFVGLHIKNLKIQFSQFVFFFPHRIPLISHPLARTARIYFLSTRCHFHLQVNIKKHKIRRDNNSAVVSDVVVIGGDGRGGRTISGRRRTFSFCVVFISATLLRFICRSLWLSLLQEWCYTFSVDVLRGISASVCLFKWRRIRRLDAKYFLPKKLYIIISICCEPVGSGVAPYTNLASLTHWLRPECLLSMRIISAL